MMSVSDRVVGCVLCVFVVIPLALLGCCGVPGSPAKEITSLFETKADPLPIGQMVDELFEGYDATETDPVFCTLQRERQESRFSRLTDRCRTREERLEFCEAVLKRMMERRKAEIEAEKKRDMELVFK